MAETITEVHLSLRRTEAAKVLDVSTKFLMNLEEASVLRPRKDPKGVFYSERNLRLAAYAANLHDEFTSTEGYDPKDFWRTLSIFFVGICPALIPGTDEHREAQIRLLSGKTRLAENGQLNGHRDEVAWKLY